jgi:putative transposase
MLTNEFKLGINHIQFALILDWCKRLTLVWNKGLRLLEDDQQRRWRKNHKGSGKHPPGLTLRYRADRFTGTGIKTTREGHKYCPIRQCVTIENPKKFFISGSYYNNTNAPELRDIPSVLRTGVHKSLLEAWKRYQDLKNTIRRPRYKGENDSLRSLTNYNAGGKSKTLKPVAIIGTDNGYVSFPKLGKLKVKGLYKRFNPTQPYGLARIVVEPSGFYLQIVASRPETTLKPSDKKVGIDPGVAACISDDSGRQVKPANLLKKQQKRLRRFQRHASRQQKGSNGQKRTYKKIALLHEKVRRSRNAFNHKLSTKLVREYGAIAFEGSNLQNMTRSPKPKQREDGKGYEHNNSKAKAGLNRALLDVAWGDLRDKVKSKCEQHDREYTATTPHNSSKECHACGEVGNRPTQSDFYCLNSVCTLYNIRQNADTNAARNHLLRGQTDFNRSYRSLGWETNVVTQRKVKQDKKDVISHPADTLSNEEKRSRNGMPPEDMTSVKSIEEVSPCRELSTATSNQQIPIPFPTAQTQTSKNRSRSRSRQHCSDHQEVSKSRKPSKKVQPLTPSIVQPTLFSLEVVGSPETLSTKSKQISSKTSPKNMTPLKRRKERRLPDSTGEIQLQLDFGCSAV